MYQSCFLMQAGGGPPSTNSQLFPSFLKKIIVCCVNCLCSNYCDNVTSSTGMSQILQSLGWCAGMHRCRELRGLFIWLVIYSAHGPQPHTNIQHIKWIITPSLMLLSSSPARASSLMLSLLGLPILTSAIVSPIWLYFSTEHAALNLN